MSSLWRDIIIAVVGLATTAVVAVKQIKEYKARRENPGFKPNPERCREHAERLTALEARESGHAKEIGMVQASIDMVAKDVKTLIEMHLRER